MIRRKPLDDDDDNPDRWLVSYADFITLLFAFFVVMYAISSVNLSKYNALTNAIDTAFSGDSAPTVPQQKKIDVKPQPEKSLIKPLPLSYLYQEKSKRERENMAKLGVDLSNKLALMIQDGKVQVMQNNRGVRIDINDSVLFNSGSADLADSAVEIINEIAVILNANQRLIQVEGHTDDTPIHTHQFYSNWELSAVRASTVVRMLNAAGVVETRLSALGYGATQPISSSDTEFGRAKNRRVSIMILYETKNELQDTLEIKPQEVKLQEVKLQEITPQVP
ncbi:flagellar motor protein [Methylophilaceae bacterium 11]|nr:flagellar motor protein [Methylophilaceae bacterium 11]